MGFLAFGIFCLIALAIAWLLVWLFGYFMPEHPAIVDKIIWGIAVLIIILKLMEVTGLMSHDPKIPHVSLGPSEVYAQPLPTPPSAFTDPMCDAKTFTVTYKPKDCPKGIGKKTGALKPDGTRTVTLTCLA